MRTILALALVLGASIPNVRADEGGTTAEFLWAKETTLATRFIGQVGLGLLDSKGLTGSRGTPIVNYVGVEYAVTPDFGLNIGLPMAGTLSGGPDGFGIGNIVLGGKYIVPLDRIAAGVGLDLGLPTAQSDSAIGLATRQHAVFVDDSFSFAPYFVISAVRDRLTFTLDLGTDLFVFTSVPPGGDRMEDEIFYDAAVALSAYENIWATLEFGGYTVVSQAGHETGLFAGPGIRYQDHEISVGFHFNAPFRKPSRDQIDFMGVFDIRAMF